MRSGRLGRDLKTSSGLGGTWETWPVCVRLFRGAASSALGTSSFPLVFHAGFGDDGFRESRVGRLVGS